MISGWDVTEIHQVPLMSRNLASERKMANSHGDREPPYPEFVEPQDCFDQALEAILSPDNPAAYYVFTAMERIVRQFKLEIEAHGLLFDAYLCGKKALQQGKVIHYPQAWLKGTAFNLAREKYRKRK